VLLSATLLLHAMSHGEQIVPREPLKDLPSSLGGWVGQEMPLEQRIVKAVGVSDYTNRIYVDQKEHFIHLYVGYYQSQRSGDTIHSPKNCLPGVGWEPLRSDKATLFSSRGQPVVVNEYLIEKGLDRQLVFYWYQGRGRIIASEYRGKFWMVADALTRNRTDGSLVRLATPVGDDESQSRQRLTQFAQELFPYLTQLIPN
jgi:EpsI family protein